MWMRMISLLLVQAAPSQAPPPRPSEPPVLVVQAVDPRWLPIPGAEVAVAPRGGKGAPMVVRADKDGYAEFWMARETEYSVKVSVIGFKPSKTQSIRISSATTSSPTAYLQLQLPFSRKPDPGE